MIDLRTLGRGASMVLSAVVAAFASGSLLAGEDSAQSGSSASPAAGPAPVVVLLGGLRGNDASVAAVRDAVAAYEKDANGRCS